MFNIKKINTCILPTTLLGQVPVPCPTTYLASRQIIALKVSLFLPMQKNSHNSELSFIFAQKRLNEGNVLKMLN